MVGHHPSLSSLFPVSLFSRCVKKELWLIFLHKLAGRQYQYLEYNHLMWPRDQCQVLGHHTLTIIFFLSKFHFHSNNSNVVLKVRTHSDQFWIFPKNNFYKKTFVLNILVLGSEERNFIWKLLHQCIYLPKWPRLSMIMLWERESQERAVRCFVQISGIRWTSVSDCSKTVIQLASTN